MNTEQTPTGYPPGVQQTNVYATASLILGILGFFTCITAPIGLVMGIVALGQIGRNPYMKGTGLAIAGIITSALCVLMIPIMAAILFPVFASAREKARATACLQNVTKISNAVRMYQSNWDDRYPLAANWSDALTPLVKERQVFICPTISGATEPCYGMNGGLSGKPDAFVQSPASTVMIFESNPGKNKAGGPELLPSKPRHSGAHSIGFADGHVMSAGRSQAGSLIWNPSQGTAQ